MNWEDCIKIGLTVVASLGGGGAIIAGFVHFCSERMAEALSKKYELKMTKELERYKSSIDKKTYISKARFDREFDMYRELSETHMTMVYDMGAAVILARGGAYAEYKSVNEFIHIAAKHIDEAEMMNKRYAPFIAKEIFEKYKELGDKAYKIISRLDLWDKFNNTSYSEIKYNNEPYTKERAKNEIEEKQKELSKLSDDILDLIREYLSGLDTVEE